MTTFFNFSDATNSQETIDAMALEQTIANGYAKKVNMRDYGYEQSGSHRGDASALANLFRAILNGRLIDENANAEQQQKNKEALNVQILELEKEAESIQAEQRKIQDVQIPKAEAEIRDHDERILQVRKDEASGLYQPGAINRFTLWKLGFSVVLLAVYLTCFYVSAVYSGIIRNIGAELEGDNDQVMTLFSNIFVPGAFSVFSLHWIAPILLFCFAIALDVIYDAFKGWVRILSITICVLVTLALDGLIAYKIEQKSQEIKSMMGLADPDHVWWLSPDFYIVVLMGFVATIVWGLLLYAFKKELAKKDAHRVVALEIRHINDLKRTVHKFIFDLKAAFADLDAKMAKLVLDIKNLKERQRTLLFSKAELEKSINDFYDGWLSYLNGLSNSDSEKAACETVREQFYARHIDGSNFKTP